MSEGGGFSLIGAIVGALLGWLVFTWLPNRRG